MRDVPCAGFGMLRAHNAVGVDADPTASKQAVLVLPVAYDSIEYGGGG